MTKDSPKPRVGSPTGNAVVTFIAAIGVGATLMAIPRAVAPDEVAGLRISDDETAEVLAQDGELAATAPTGADVESFTTLGAELATAEVVPHRHLGEVAQEALNALATVREQHGEEAVTALRARDLETLETDLFGDEDAVGRIGALRSTLEQYGAIDGDRRIAPFIVMYAIAKARWNLRYRLEVTDGLSNPELRAYWGWLALHATATEPGLRLSALEPYIEAGGEAPDETRATLLYLGGASLESAEQFQALHEEVMHFRHRNHALAAVGAASE